MASSRPRSFDVAAAAVALALITFLVVTLRGYRWTGSVDSGLLRAARFRLTVAVADPALAQLARELRPGIVEAETLYGPQSIDVVYVEPERVAGGVRIGLLLDAGMDRSGRVFWADQRLRRGEVFTFAGTDWKLAGVLLGVEPVEPVESVKPEPEPEPDSR